jgi:hypothetical protein
MTRTLIAVAFGAGMTVSAGSASAVILEVTLTEPGYTATWEQDSNPVPISYISDDETKIPVFNASENSGLTDSAFYFNQLFGGGFGGLGGPQLYSGPESSPVFSVGSFTGFNQGENAPVDVVITFSLAPIPEASTWVMMIAGFVGLGALSFRARRRGFAA